jgi:tripartite-type tricarboxylate transporter receptor subunit TctC
VLVVPANAPYKSVGELVAFAKANPGKLSFGSGSSSSRIAGEMLKQLAGVDILHVPYKSNPLAITDLLGGQINLMITDVSTGVPQIKAGKLRALGYSTQAQRPAARCAHHCRSRRQGLRHGLLVCRLRPPIRRPPWWPGSTSC